MELTYALVVTLVSLVTATPHGYGVKGGALAKADAGAVAGSFGGAGEIPLSIPSGSGFSGSYSKSSSSSFASSSASSSSSSFSYNGSGVGGLTSNGLGTNGITSNDGCGSTNCQNNRNNGINDSRGASTTGLAYSGAKVAASAGSITSAGLPAYSKNANHAPCITGDCSNVKSLGCEGSKCDDNKCKSGQCQPNSPAEASFEYNSKEKCTTGQCGASSQVGSSNDIHVNIAGVTEAKSTTGANDHFKDDIIPTGFTDFGARSTTTQAHNKPNIYLTAPKQQAPCTSSNCETPVVSIYDKENLPSSYNVPIHGTYLGSPSQGHCTSESCRNDHSKAPNGASNCGTGNCNDNTDSTSKIPSYGASPIYGSTVATVGIPPSHLGVSPPISKYPIYSQSAPTNAPSTNVGATSTGNLFSGSFATKPNVVTTTNQKLPPYSGGFGGPPGILKPNELNTPVNVPIYKPSTTLGPHPTSCISGNCGSGNVQIHSESGSNNNQKPPISTGYNPSTPCSSGNCGSPVVQPSYISSGSPSNPIKPTGTINTINCPSGQCGTRPGQPSVQYDHTGPTQPTSGFGGPAGILKPNDHNIPTVPMSSYKPSSSVYVPPGPISSQNDKMNSPSAIPNKPTASIVTGTATPCSFGNCGTQPSQPSNNYAHVSFSSPTAPSGSYKPISCSSGNCGHNSDIPSPPSGPNSNVLCSSGNCGSQSPSPSQFGQSGALYKPIAPANSYSPSPCSSGNCGSQSTHSSTQYAQSSSIAGAQQVTPDVLGTYKPTSCSSGNCESKPNQPSIHNDQSVSPVANKPVSCISGDCVSQPVQHLPHHSQSISAPIITSSVTNNAIPCVTGNCGAPSGHFGSIPTAPTGTYKPISCASGNCGGQTGQPTSPFGQSGVINGVFAAAGAVASANAIAYTGGFGGPPGLLKPYDDGKLSGAGFPSLTGKYSTNALPGVHHSAAPVGGVHPSYGKSINGADTLPQTGTGVLSSAVAGASAGAYNDNVNQLSEHKLQTGLNGSDNHKEGGCKGGCESNGSGNGAGYDRLNTSGALAKSVASASAGSFGGSFASSSASAHASAGAGTKGYGRR